MNFHNILLDNKATPKTISRSIILIITNIIIIITTVIIIIINQKL